MTKIAVADFDEPHDARDDARPDASSPLQPNDHSATKYAAAVRGTKRPPNSACCGTRGAARRYFAREGGRAFGGMESLFFANARANGFMNIATHFRFQDELDAPRLRRAAALLCARRAILRSRVVVANGRPGYVVVGPADAPASERARCAAVYRLRKEVFTRLEMMRERSASNIPQIVLPLKTRSLFECICAARGAAENACPSIAFSRSHAHCGQIHRCSLLGHTAKSTPASGGCTRAAHARLPAP